MTLHEDNFTRAVEFVLKHEGGYVNNPNDPGGETNFGISKRVYPHLDIKNLTKDEAKRIYHSDYWLKAGCDVIEWPMCLVFFDTAVNMGIIRAQEFQIKALNWTDYLFLRIDYYNRLAAQPSRLGFLRGWINRTLDLWRTIKEVKI